MVYVDVLLDEKASFTPTSPSRLLVMMPATAISVNLNPKLAGLVAALIQYWAQLFGVFLGLLPPSPMVLSVAQHDAAWTQMVLQPGAQPRQQGGQGR